MATQSTPDLAFGSSFTPHRFVARGSRSHGWDQGKLVAHGQLTLPPTAGVLHYGQGIFEGLKAWRGVDGQLRLVNLDFTAARMARGAERLCLPPVPQELYRRALLELLRVDGELAPALGKGALYLRPYLFGSEGYLGVRPSELAEFHVVASPVSRYFKGPARPLRLLVEREYSRAAPGGLGAVKATANYAASLLATERAKGLGYDQVLWTDARQHEWVEEAGTMNVAFVIHDEVERFVTPPTGDTVLAGATRHAAMTLLRERGMRVDEHALSLGELRARAGDGSLRECLGLGTAAGIAPIAELWLGQERWTMSEPQGPVANWLTRSWDDVVLGRRDDARFATVVSAE